MKSTGPTYDKLLNPGRAEGNKYIFCEIRN